MQLALEKHCFGFLTRRGYRLGQVEKMEVEQELQCNHSHLGKDDESKVWTETMGEMKMDRRHGKMSRLRLGG